MSNPYQSPRAEIELVRPRRTIFHWTRPALSCIGWLPALYLISFFVPQFANMFAVLHQRGELPAATAWLLWFGLWNEELFFIPCLLILALLFLNNAGIDALFRKLHWPYGIWLECVAVMGMLGAAAVVYFMLLPAICHGGPI